MIGSGVQMHDLDYYQERSRETAIYPTDDKRVALMYVAGGVCDEAGEVFGKVKKWVRRGADPAELPQLVADVKKESGDVLWYLARVADELTFLLSEAAGENIAKLESRQERGVLEGSGDDR